jgi:hypothetical protein
MKPHIHLNSENHNFLTIFHCQTYQNYLGAPERFQNSDFQIRFSVLKISGIFLDIFSLNNIRPSFICEIFDFQNIFFSKNVPNFWWLSY